MPRKGRRMLKGLAHAFVRRFLVTCLAITALITFCCYTAMAQEEKADEATSAQKMLTSSDLKWLHQHGKIRMAYISNLLGNCAKDPATGELIGSLATYVDRARDCFANGQLEFAPFAYPTIEAELAALERGEVDCIFPLYTDAKQAKERGFLVTQSLFNCDVVALVRDASFDEKQKNVVALSGAKINKRIYLEKYYPHWQIKQYKSDRACVDAVKKGDADCAIFNSYGIEHIIGAQELNSLSTKILVGSMDLSLAVRGEDVQLQSILNRSIALVSTDVLNKSMKDFGKPSKLAKDDLGISKEKVILVVGAITFLAACAILVVVVTVKRSK